MPVEVDRREVQRLMAAGAQLVDVMPGKEWSASHITGALHLPLRKIGVDGPAKLDPDRAVILYCYDSL